MESLMHLEQAFTRLFRMDEWESDPGFSRFHSHGVRSDRV